MNTKKRIVIIILLAVFTICCYISSFIILKESLNPHGKYSADENNVQSYGSSIIKMNNKIYVPKLSYSGDLATGGLFELDSSGSKLVLDYEKSGLHSNTFDFQVFNKSLIILDTDVSKEDDESAEYPIYENTVYCLDTKNCKLKKLSKLKNIENIDNYFTDNDTLYLTTGNKLYASYDAVNTKQIFDLNSIPENSGYLIDNNTIYYISNDNYITQYNFKNNKILLKKKLPKTVMRKNNRFSLYKIGNNFLLLNYNEDDEKTEILNIKSNFKKIYSSFDDCSICGYNDKLFAGNNESGIYSINIKNGKSKQIYNSENYSLSVFGDKWLYFTDEKSHLHRIFQDGNNVETIFW